MRADYSDSTTVRLFAKEAASSMPAREHYHNLTLSEAVRKFADHHYDEAIRHISRDEHRILREAADWMESNGCKRRVLD